MEAEKEGHDPGSGWDNEGDTYPGNTIPDYTGTRYI